MNKLSGRVLTRRELLKSSAAGLLCAGIPAEVLAASAALSDPLVAEFIKPPDEARPWVYWYFMDGHLTREGMTADLESMKEAGIGGAIYLEVGLGIEPGPVKFMSDPWQRLLGHAFSEADRLGLQMALAAGPGWCGTGGPWVKPEESMQHLVASETTVLGPAAFHAQLVRPTPRAPFFGETPLPTDLHQTWKDFYLDVVVLAFPTPAGDTRITDVDEKALYTRGSYSSQIPGPSSNQSWVRPFLPTAADYSAEPDSECIASSQILDLTDRMAPDGTLHWDAPSGNWTILRMGRTITGQTTRPAPTPGIGLETDKFSRTALDAHFKAYIAELLGKTGRAAHRGRGLTTLHFDSWEMGSQNWSEEFRKDFLKRRGYDLIRFLPVFSGYVVNSSETSERFLWDIRQTAQELVLDNQVGRLKELGQGYGLDLSLEPYDLDPCSDLSLGSAPDVPMGEFWSKGWDAPTDFSVVEATSAGHTTGRRIIGAEAFTASVQEKWQQYPGSMKAQGDWALCAGVNRFVFHRFQSQPWMDRFPGMTMGPNAGYGVHWERTQTWWSMVPAYHLYLSRCQQMLRRGLFVADILYLAAEGAPNVFLPPTSAFLHGQLADRRGYNFDGCAPKTLIQRASVKNGSIVFPDGMTYRVLVLPDLETMTPELLQKIVSLVEDGATIVGSAPQKSPSLAAYPDCDRKVRDLASRLWGDGSATFPRKLGKGQVFCQGRQRPAAELNPMTNAKWIWSSTIAASPTETVMATRFFLEFSVEDVASVASAELTLTATVASETMLNGQSVETAKRLRMIPRVDVTSLLVSGDNMLTVMTAASREKKMPPGLIGTMTITFSDNRMAVYSSGRNWKCTSAASDLSMNTVELGDFHAAPWGLQDWDIQERNLYPSYRVTAQILSSLNIQPDFESGGHLRYIHRRDENDDIYFLANRDPTPIATTCTFRVRGRQPEWWNAITGTRRDLPHFKERNRCTSIDVALEPFESGFVIFRRRYAKRAKPKTREGNFAELRTIMTLSEPWQVSFDPKWGGPEKIVFAILEDWSRHAAPGIRHYSGKATYNTRFDTSSDIAGKQSFLSLGLVKNLASVKLNGHDLGILWCDPWRVALPKGLLRHFDNHLEIIVANLWINRLIEDSGLSPQERLTWLPSNPFHPDSQLQSSGLLGPVTLQAAT